MVSLTMTGIYFCQTDQRPRWVTLTGPDAQAFLHRLSTVDMNSLSIGETRPGCFLNGQGKIECFFYIHRMEDHAFGFELWGSSAPLFEEFVERFHFGEDFQVNLSEMQCACLFGTPIPSELPQDMRNYSGPHFHRVWATPPTLSSWMASLSLPRLSEEEFHLWRIQQLIPLPPQEIHNASNPLELGLESAIARTKGCYPGQEVIEKIYTYSEPPKRLVLLETASPLSEGTELFKEGKKVGRITSSAKATNENDSLALIGKLHLDPQSEIQTSDGVSVKIKQVSAFTRDE